MLCQLSYPGTARPEPGQGAGYQARRPPPEKVRSAHALGYEGRVRSRTGLLIGFAAGYYFGSRAGRERYEQIRRVLDTVPVGAVSDKARALGSLALERLRQEAVTAS